MNKPVIALVGYPASGKEGVAGILRDRGFVSYSGGDVLRRISQNRGLSIDRDQLKGLGDVMRDEMGSETLFLGARKKMRQISEDSSIKGLIADSIKNPGEVRFLQSEFGAFVLHIAAPNEETRFKRMLGRRKPGDPTTWEGFLELKAIDDGIGQELTGQNTAGCIALADFTLVTEGSLKDVELKVDSLLASRDIVEGGMRGRELR